jgi:hypothetical protein
MANPETPKATPPKTDAPLPAFPSFPSFPNFDPMSMWAAGQQTFTKLMTDAAGRWQSFTEQYAAIEQQVSTHAQDAVNHWAQLAKDAIAYGTQLSAEARKMSLETAKKMGVGA